MSLNRPFPKTQLFLAFWVILDVDARGVSPRLIDRTCPSLTEGFLRGNVLLLRLVWLTLVPFLWTKALAGCIFHNPTQIATTNFLEHGCVHCQPWHCKFSPAPSGESTWEMESTHRPRTWWVDFGKLLRRRVQRQEPSGPAAFLASEPGARQPCRPRPAGWSSL